MTICRDCKKHANFNFKSLKEAMFCKLHAEPGMVNIVSKRCEFDDCETIPNYNFKDQKKALFCKLHAEPGMIDIKNKRCQKDDCDKQPSYNFKDQKKALFCKLHAEPGMIDIKSKRCEFDDCDKQPTYNFKDQKKRLFCKLHAEPGMVDVMSKRCQKDDCETLPSYNFKGQKERLYCKLHAEPGMVDVTSKRCQKDDCETQPVYNFKDQKKAMFCKLHAESDMIDVKSKRCQLCEMTIANYNGFCAPCFYHSYPEHAKTRNHKTRENSFMFPLKELYPDLTLDKTVSGGCSKRRPDGHIELFTHGIIIEIDENQHAGYSCENKRTMEIFQDLGSRPLIFIRLNPDSYTIDGKKHLSAFSLSKATGSLSPKPKEFGMRFNALLEAIEEAKKIPTKEITTIELFYTQ